MELDRQACLDALAIDEADVPRLALVTSAWAHGTPPAELLGRLGTSRPAGPGMQLVHTARGPLLHCGAYGATRAVEPVHLAGGAGVPLAILVGWCVALQPGLEAGDVVVAQTATIGEGASQYYGAEGTASADADLTEAVADALAARGIPVHRGRVVTSGALLGPEERVIESWAGAGHLALDLEASAVLSAAAATGMRATALLLVRHPLPEGAGWLVAIRAASDRVPGRTARLLLDVAVEIGLAAAP
jgi:Phosphorylase superfamily